MKHRKYTKALIAIFFDAIKRRQFKYALIVLDVIIFGKEIVKEK